MSTYTVLTGDVSRPEPMALFGFCPECGRAVIATLVPSEVRDARSILNFDIAFTCTRCAEKNIQPEVQA